MKKEDIRREFFKLKTKGFSYTQCRRIINAEFEHSFSVRTLKRWMRKLDAGEWDLRDKSQRPHRIHYKLNPQIEKEILLLRAKTGWGCDKLAA